MKSWNVFLYNFCSQKLQLTLLLAKVYIESVQTVGREKCWCWCLLWTCPDCPALVRDMVRYVLQIFSLILFLSEVKFYDNGVTSDMKYFQLPVRRSTQRISSSGRLGWVEVSSGKARQEICHILQPFIASVSSRSRRLGREVWRSAGWPAWPGVTVEPSTTLTSVNCLK